MHASKPVSSESSPASAGGAVTRRDFMGWMGVLAAAAASAPAALAASATRSGTRHGGRRAGAAAHPAAGAHSAAAQARIQKDLVDTRKLVQKVRAFDLPQPTEPACAFRAFRLPSRTEKD